MASIDSNPVHLVTPVVRCINAIRARDAYDAPPGAAPFSRFLQANRIANHGHQHFTLSTIHEPPQSPAPDQPAAMPAPLLPKLGELIEPQPRAKIRAEVVQRYEQLNPATGRALDIYA